MTLSDQLWITAAAFAYCALYPVPTVIACMRKHHNRLPIGLVNVLLGWTGIGWIAALVWSLTSPPPTTK